MIGGQKGCKIGRSCRKGAEQLTGIATQIGKKKGRSRGGSKGGANGGSRRAWNKARKRDPRVVPPAWVEAIDDNYPDLVELVVEWQRGSGEYKPMSDLGAYNDTWTFADEEGSDRRKTPGDQRSKLAEEMGQTIWDYLVYVCECDGPAINFKLYGIGTNKKGEQVVLFEIARQCAPDKETMGGIADPEAGGSEVHAALKFATLANKDLQGNFIKLTNSVAEPFKGLGDLATEGLRIVKTGVSLQQDVALEKLRLEEAKLRKANQKKLIEAGERIINRTVDVVVSDLGSQIFTLLNARYGGDTPPDSIMEIGEQLAKGFPYAAKAWLDQKDGDDLGTDFLSACARAAQAEDEYEAAATFAGIAERLKKYTEELRARLDKRNALMLHILRGRLIIFKVEI